MIQRIGLHLLFWVAILLWRTKGDYFSKLPFEKFFYHNLLRLPLIMAATYTVIYYLLPKFIINQKKYFHFVGSLVGVLLVTNYIDQSLTSSHFMKMVLQPASEKELKWLTQLHPFRTSFMLLGTMVSASLIRFLKIFQEQEKKKNQLIQAHLETQYAFLKAQVNPHFLFNALNNIYSMAVQKDQQEIASGIENLSGIMKYLTYESNTKKVPLTREIELLKNYIEIEQLRIADDDDTTISFNLEGNIDGLKIAPVILLPLVENAFKHGVKPEENCLVSIKFIVVKNTLTFSIKNTFFEKSPQAIQEKGIGLANVKKRLELLYPNQYKLELKAVDGYYYTLLNLDLGTGDS